MSKCELINSASESETSDDEYLFDFTKLQPYMCEHCVSRESKKENCLGKKKSVSKEDTSKIGNTLWCSCGK